MYRKHETRRFYQDQGKFWTKSRLITMWKWIYVVIIGVLVGFAGSIVSKLIDALIKWKLEVGKCAMRASMSLSVSVSLSVCVSFSPFHSMSPSLASQVHEANCSVSTLSLSAAVWYIRARVLTATSRVEDGDWAEAFFAYQFMSIFFIVVAAGLCYVVPNATGIVVG